MRQHPCRARRCTRCMLAMAGDRTMEEQARHVGHGRSACRRCCVGGVGDKRAWHVLVGRSIGRRRWQLFAGWNHDSAALFAGGTMTRQWNHDSVTCLGCDPAAPPVPRPSDPRHQVHADGGQSAQVPLTPLHQPQCPSSSTIASGPPGMTTQSIEALARSMAAVCLSSGLQVESEKHFGLAIMPVGSTATINCGQRPCCLGRVPWPQCPQVTLKNGTIHRSPGGARHS
ncbi:hypothetical protein QBC39DRAFT_360129 [Podospora conica]|nr:hypothetical protein QBC39DRAFT_360129 [Schizothecium conicum]